MDDNTAKAAADMIAEGAPAEPAPAPAAAPASDGFKPQVGDEVLIDGSSKIISAVQRSSELGDAVQHDSVGGDGEWIPMSRVSPLPARRDA